MFWAEAEVDFVMFVFSVEDDAPCSRVPFTLDGDYQLYLSVSDLVELGWSPHVFSMGNTHPAPASAQENSLFFSYDLGSYDPNLVCTVYVCEV